MKLLPALLISTALFAQVDLNSLKELKYRNIGPFRGGRSVAATGVPSQPSTYYFGATGGGVFKTTDGGANWTPITDGQIKTGSVGAIAVSESEPNVIYVGMGEPDIRGNASVGDGMYKSTDAGRTWKHIGLEKTQQIGAVKIHPKNPDVVYVAALGHQFGANEERGIYKTVDGGKTWKQIYTRGPKAGAVELVLDPNNPNTIFATFWEVYRTPWLLSSGGPGSGIFKSTDAGETWTDISRNPGMPKGLLGRIGVTVSPVNSDRVWVLAEAEDGGVFRSDDGGKTFTKTNEQRILRQRAWYYSRIFADPTKLDTVWVPNVGFHKSDDGGKTFATIRPPHGDNHFLWLAPNDSNRLILSNDGGATISTNGGKTWSTVMNQPTAQFYRVALDDDFPYHAYGAQQDNTTIKTKTRADGPGITESDWYPVGGGESGWIQPKPGNSDVVYAGSYDGLLTRYEHRTGQMRNITVYPDNPMGSGVEAMKYRFQWDFPIFLSPHDPKVLYTGGNVLFKSINEGQSWTPISPDLTTDDKSKQGPSGGPITKDNTAVEYYCTIFTGAESPVKAGVIWIGSDDGLVHVTQDAGKSWQKVTPPDLPKWSRINSIEASPFDAGTAYFAATLYQMDDFTPLLYKTTDYGKSWTKIVNGIPGTHFTRVIREDPNKKNLLVAGTEFGIYVSYNGGANWQSIQLNMPIVPVTDIAFHKRENEMVVATQGRAFYVLDDMPLLYQLASASAMSEAAHLFQPKDAYREPGGGFRLPSDVPVGQNPATGVVVYYLLKDKPAEKAEVTLEFLDASGKLVKKMSNKEERQRGPDPGFVMEEEEGGGRRGRGTRTIPADKGLNRFVWDMRYPDATGFPGLIMWAGTLRGPAVVPGKYTVKLTAAGVTQTQTFEIKKDPRISTTPQEFSKQLEVALQVRDKLSQTNQAVIDIREVRKQLQEYGERVKNQKIVDAAKSLAKKLTEVEEALYQTKNRANEDPLNFPIMLNNKLASLLSDITMADAPPTQQQDVVYEDLASRVNAELRKLTQMMGTDVPSFNSLVKTENIPAVVTRGEPK
jgi:photosystem II stability/assembly factor-like uncharacterized protein